MSLSTSLEALRVGELTFDSFARAEASFFALGGHSPDLAAMLHDEYEVPLDQESAGNTALHWCVRRRRYDLAEWLLGAGADVNAVGYRWDRAGQTPLAVARQSGDAKFVQILQKAGGRG